MPPIIDRLTSLVLVVVSMIDQRAESCHQMMRSYGVVGCITIRGMLVVSGREQLQKRRGTSNCLSSKRRAAT